MNETTSTKTEGHSSAWHFWRELQERDRGGRAELRRCATTAEVAFTAPYHRLLRRLGSRMGEADERRAALLAGVLAHIDRDDGVAIARRMGSAGPGGDSPIVSDARFRQILRADDDDELLRSLIRVVRQLDRTVAVEPLFKDLFAWGDRTRQRWARDYYEASPLTAKEA